jgi:hypothetical protein
MKKPPRAPKRPPDPRAEPLDVGAAAAYRDWERFTVQLPTPVYWRLKVRAAQEQREIRATLVQAIESYLATPPAPEIAGGKS